eukprot:TRINITY_DN65592_c10_g4_i1.p1 TRINITY_DN65592_c10_g4~~TRINITY_DN65592_c10_g4_i1.p1  ORF type:complete len:327 (+),score=4.66 TRINITY_DN65592_c10_g4_i1:82-1062(+)
MAELDQLLGSKISLISQQDIRYEGVLFSINAQESSIVLQKVKCYGTEDRETSQFVPINNNLMPFVSFPGNEIKDLFVHEEEQNNPQPPDKDDNKDNNKDQDNTTKKVMKKTNKSIKNEMDVDPITLSPYEKVTYEYTTPNGCQIKYNITSIIGHIYKTGELKDPVTRNPLTDEDLTDIDNISKTYSESKLPSVLKVKENREYYNKIKQENGTIAGLEACLGEMVAELLTAIETVRPNNNYYYNKSEMEIYLIFSSFDIPFSELKRLNIENAYHCYKHWMSYLKGPPKKPTVNNMGILDVTLHLLKTHWSSEDEEALKKYRQNNSTT